MIQRVGKFHVFTLGWPLMNWTENYIYSIATPEIIIKTTKRITRKKADKGFETLISLTLSNKKNNYQKTETKLLSGFFGGLFSLCLFFFFKLN